MSEGALTTGRRAGAARAIAAVLAALTVLVGCAGAPPTSVQRYVLGVAEAATPPPAETTRGVRLTSLSLAPYLGGDGIVMQTSEVAVHEARNNLWAEDLQTQLRRSLKRQLARRMKAVRVLEQGDPEPPTGGLRRLEVEVSAFQGRYDGFAVVGGQWRLRDGDGRLLASRRFSVERPLETDGYQALVESLTAAWRSVAAEIAPAVEQSWSR